MSNGSPRRSNLERFYRRAAVERHHPPVQGLPHEDSPVGRVVVDDQQPPAGQDRLISHDPVARLKLSRGFRVNRECEDRTRTAWAALAPGWERRR